jgi:arylsulfatase A-like enzyme
MLRSKGYDTACIGKWHLGWVWPHREGTRFNSKTPIGVDNEEWSAEFSKGVDFSQPIQGGPTERGFDYYFGDDVPNFPPYSFIENDRLLAAPSEHYPGASFSRPGPAAPGWDMVAVMPALAEKAAAYIRAEPGQGKFGKEKDRPFFLYLPLTAPHTPIAPAPRFKGKSEAGLYGDFVCEVDWLVGEVLEALRDSGRLENTLVFFTSDNGSPAKDGTGMSGENRSVLRYGHNPSHLFRGIKADIWEGGHRVPFFAMWSGKIPAGATCEETICHVDFMATLAALVSAEIPEGAAEDSHNILPALFQKKYESPLRPAVVHHSGNGLFAIREGEWKFIDGKGSGGFSGPGKEGDPPAQLYNLNRDLGETTNLLASEPAQAERLSILLETLKASPMN